MWVDERIHRKIISCKDEYLETYAWKILGPYTPETVKPLAERIDVEAAIQHWHEKREALYKQINEIQPALARYWMLLPDEQDMIRRGRR